MKKLVLVLLTVSVLILIPAAAMGINSPVVSQNHGVITGMFVSDIGLSVGLEYGFTRNLALSARVMDDWTKIGVKYELNPNIALLGGVLESSPFIGINGSMGINRDLLGLYEVDLYMTDGDFNFMYEFGAKFNLAKNLDVRGGLLGAITGDDNELFFELGVGYCF